MILIVAIAAAVEPRPLEAYDFPEATTWGFDVSPDGQSLAYVHRTPDGRSEVLVAPTADPTDTRAVFDTDEDLYAYWDLGNRFLVLQTYGATGGILSVDVDTGELRRLTDGIGVGLRHAIGDGRFAVPLQARTWREEAASVTAASPGAEEIVVHAGREWYESRVVALDPTREVPPEILWRGKWWTNGFEFLLDNELRPAFAWEWRMKSGFEGTPDEAWVHDRVDFWALKANGKHKWTGKETRAVESPQWRLISDRVIDGRIVEIDDHEHDTAAVWSRAVETGDLELLWSDPRADVTRAVLDEDGALAAVAIDRARREWTALDPALGDDFTFLSANLPGDYDIPSWRQYLDRDTWLVTHESGDDLGSIWLYRRQTKSLVRVGPDRGAFDAEKWQPMEAVDFTARDGLPLTMVVTRPDEARFGAGPWPGVLVVHGGPWGARDRLEFREDHQILADHGYAVISINFRGSGGFGTAFAAAGVTTWGAEMQDDLFDGLAWSVEHGIVDARRTAVTGDSYGAYATLAALTLTPGTFRCGIAGAADGTLLREAPGGDLEYTVLGPRDVRKARSPVTHVDSLDVPVLVWHGALDAIVPRPQIEGFVDAAQVRGKRITFVDYPDEGHGLRSSANYRAQWALDLTFLAQCLGGIPEPLDVRVAASTLRVPVGADQILGLSAALAARDAP